MAGPTFVDGCPCGGFVDVWFSSAKRVTAEHKAGSPLSLAASLLLPSAGNVSAEGSDRLEPRGPPLRLVSPPSETEWLLFEESEPVKRERDSQDQITIITVTI